METAVKHTVSEGAMAVLLLGGYCSVLCSCQTELFITYTELALAEVAWMQEMRRLFRFWPHAALTMAGSCYYTCIL